MVALIFLPAFFYQIFFFTYKFVSLYKFFWQKKSSEIRFYPKQKKKVSRFLLKATKDTTENQKWPKLATNIVYICFLNGKKKRFFLLILKKKKKI